MICALELYKYFGAQDPLRFGSRMHKARARTTSDSPLLYSPGLAILRPTRVDAADSLTNSQLRCWWNAGPAHAPSVRSAADLPMNMVPSHDYKRGVVLMTAPAGPKALRVGMSPGGSEGATTDESGRSDENESESSDENERERSDENGLSIGAVARERPRRMP